MRTGAGEVKTLVPLLAGGPVVALVGAAMGAGVGVVAVSLVATWAEAERSEAWGVKVVRLAVDRGKPSSQGPCPALGGHRSAPLWGQNSTSDQQDACLNRAWPRSLRRTRY